MQVEFGQPAPVSNDKPASWELCIADMRARDNFGRSKYGTPLQPMNGRNSLKDAYEEILDTCVYLRNMLEEQELKKNEASKLVDSMMTGSMDKGSIEFKTLMKVRSALYTAEL